MLDRQQQAGPVSFPVCVRILEVKLFGEDEH